MNLKEEIYRIFDSVQKHNEYPAAIEQIRDLNATDNELFEILWTEAIQTQSSKHKTFPCAYTLYQLNIKCPLGPKEALEQVIKEWDISIEEIPWYLANQFSKEVIIKAVNELSDEENVRLKAVLYWVKMK